MTSKANTLGQFIADLMRKHEHSNRSLASLAGVSESAIRNLLKVGMDPKAKDPDARTLSLVAKALEVDAIRLFRLAEYIPPQPAAHTPRADYLADTFDELSVEQQNAVLSVLEAIAEKADRRAAIQQMRDDPANPLAGIDLSLPDLTRPMANQLIAQCQMTEAVDVEKIELDTKIFHYTWASLPQSTQERIKALIRHKLSLDYDPTMVDPEWRT